LRGGTRSSTRVPRLAVPFADNREVRARACGPLGNSSSKYVEGARAQPSLLFCCALPWVLCPTRFPRARERTPVHSDVSRPSLPGSHPRAVKHVRNDRIRFATAVGQRSQPTASHRMVLKAWSSAHAARCPAVPSLTCARRCVVVALSFRQRGLRAGSRLQDGHARQEGRLLRRGPQGVHQGP
jgi:hypothetical protein